MSTFTNKTIKYKLNNSLAAYTEPDDIISKYDIFYV